MKRILGFTTALALVSTAGALTVLDVTDYGVAPDGTDAVEGVARVLEAAKACTDDVEIVFPAGTYHFYPDKAQTHRLFISNHDQTVEHAVGIPVVGFKNCTITGNGAHFVFHGGLMPILIQDSENTTCCGFSVSYATPFSAEGRIVAAKRTSTVMEFDPVANPPWKLEDDRFIINGENGPHRPDCAIAFRGDGMIVPTGRYGDIVWSVQAKPAGKNRVEFLMFNAAANGYSVGDTIVLRNATRPHPAMTLYRATDTLVQDVVFHDSQGMALLAQRCKNVHVKGGGCICAPGRVHSVSADACHFSNCCGAVVVEDATFEAMMDDAINVHATSLRITDISEDRLTVTVLYPHRQAYGFETFRPGENVRFIHAATLENVERTAAVKEVVMPSLKTLRLTLATPVPQDICEGDAVENADWHPSVVFRNNTVLNNRARGALFTTPKPVLVEGNRFIHSSGSAILLAGDAAGWYESGACQDVTIRNNVFEHNLTCRYQFTHGIISICPEISEPEKQTRRYHRNIRIEGNTFTTHRVPLLYAISAEDVILRDNRVEWDDLYAPMNEGRPYDTEYCDNLDLQRF